MKKKEVPPTDAGVIVGRFQVHELHDAHIDLIQSVCSMHEKVIIFLGLSPARVTRNNPLDFEMRKQMILEKFPNVIVLYIKDVKDDDAWSKSLDEQIKDIVGLGTATLYGSRDSFINHYTGKYPTEELESDVYISGTEIRNSISKKVKNTPEFRAGVIWAAYNQYPKVWPTVDIAVMNEDYTKVLLARKPNENQYRFIGGFADPDSNGYEADARREVMEEASIDITDPIYIGSFYVDDWRYRQEVDSIKTNFFICKYRSGRPDANDDICEVRWFELTEVNEHIDLVENHRVLFQRLRSYFEDKKNNEYIENSKS